MGRHPASGVPAAVVRAPSWAYNNVLIEQAFGPGKTVA
jgi:hypothetical protein